MRFERKSASVRWLSGHCAGRTKAIGYSDFDSVELLCGLPQLLSPCAAAKHQIKVFSFAPISGCAQWLYGAAQRDLKRQAGNSQNKPAKRCSLRWALVRWYRRGCPIEARRLWKLCPGEVNSLATKGAGSNPVASTAGNNAKKSGPGSNCIMGARRSERGRDNALPVLNGEVSEEAPKTLRTPSP